MKIEINKTIQTIVVCLLLIGAAGAVSEFGNNIIIPGDFTGVNANFSGEVGIGTTDPAAKLQVVTSSSDGSVNDWDNGEFVVGRSGSQGSGVYIAYKDLNNTGYIGALTPGTAWRNLVLQGFGGNVGIGNTTPANVLSFSVGSSTDPIADAWLTYSTSDTKQVLYEADVDFVKATNELRNAKIYAWQRTPTEPIRYGVIANDLSTPESIIAYHDGKKNTNKYALNAKPQGIDNGAYIGWLHEVVKAQDAQIQQQQIQIDYLYQRLNLVKP